MARQAARTPERGIPGGEPGCMTQSGFNRIARKESGKCRRAEYITAAGRVEGLNMRRGNERGPDGRTVGRSDSRLG